MIMVSNIEKQTLQDILKSIDEYKNIIKKQEENIKKTFLSLLVHEIIQVNNNVDLSIDRTKELIINTKDNLTLIERAITPENLRSISGVRNIQRLVQRSIEDIDEKAKRVFYNKHTTEGEFAVQQINNFCKDFKTQFVRFCEDLLTGVVNIFKSSSEQNKKLGEALDKDSEALFKSSLNTLFSNTKEDLKKQIHKKRELEQHVTKVEVEIGKPNLKK